MRNALSVLCALFFVMFARPVIAEEGSFAATRTLEMRIIAGMKDSSCKHVIAPSHDGDTLKIVFSDSGLRFISWGEQKNFFSMTVYEEDGSVIRFVDENVDGVVDEITVIRGSPSPSQRSKEHFAEVLARAGNRLL